MQRQHHLLAIGAIFVVCVARAAPFVVSDPWPPTRDQPTHCRYTLNGGSAVDAPVAKNADGTVYCLMDVAGAVIGKNTLTVEAVNKNAHPESVSPARSLTFESPSAPADPSFGARQWGDVFLPGVAGAVGLLVALIAYGRWRTARAGRSH